MDVREDSGRDRAAVVAAPAHQHHTQLGHSCLRLEHVSLFDGGDAGAAVGCNRNAGSLVCVIAGDCAVGNGDIGRVDGERGAEHRAGRL